MKPIKLVIEGINSFTDAQVLDFEAVGRSNLFCICGKTGAGKTTIFDSIMLALYGRSGKGNLADAVNLSRSSGAVTLDFSARGETYRVERVIKCRSEKNGGEPTGKRTASSECTLYKGETPIAKGEEAAARIAELIGLCEGEFKNVYLLEQGEYAEFLKKPPAKQLETVGKIFSLMRFGDVYKLAGERMRDEEREADTSDRMIAEIGDVTAEYVREEKTKLASLKGKAAAFTREIDARGAELAVLQKTHDEYLAVVEKQKTVAKHAARLDEAKEKALSAETELKAFMQRNDGTEADKRIAELREKLNALSALSALDRECDAAKLDVERKTSILEDKKNRRTATETQCAAAERNAVRLREEFAKGVAEFLQTARDIARPSEVFKAARLALEKEKPNAADAASAYYSLISELNAFSELEKKRVKEEENIAAADKAAAAALEKTEKYAAALKTARAELESATAAENAASEALDRARVASHAAAVAEGLKAGDRCPVCGGVYNGGVCAAADVGEKKQKKDGAERARKKIEAQIVELEKYADMSGTEYERKKGDADNARAAEREYAAREKESGVQPEIYAKLIKTLETARSRGNECEAAEREYAERAPELAAANAEERAAEEALKESETKAKQLSDRLGDMMGKTDNAVSSVKTELAEAERIKTEYENRRRAIEKEAETANAAVAAVGEMLEAARRDCPVDTPIFDEEGYAEKRRLFDEVKENAAKNSVDVNIKEKEIEELVKKSERVKALKAERAEHRKRAERYGKIAEMTKGKAMLNFVANEYIQDFTAAASDILGALSGGKYSMRYDSDGGFAVSDYLNDGKTRKTDTLSGGELFLASLSVAIAIARAVGTEDNAFFFLDEGFGTLDDELIDTVYGALEELARTCLVGVISHSSALIEKMPACVEVQEATDTVGSRIRY